MGKYAQASRVGMPGVMRVNFVISLFSSDLTMSSPHPAREWGPPPASPSTTRTRTTVASSPSANQRKLKIITSKLKRLIKTNREASDDHPTSGKVDKELDESTEGNSVSKEFSSNIEKKQNHLYFAPARVDLHYRTREECQRVNGKFFFFYSLSILSQLLNQNTYIWLILIIKWG